MGWMRTLILYPFRPLIARLEAWRDSAADGAEKAIEDYVRTYGGD